MTSCQQSQETIEQYVAGTLARADALMFERHLASCPRCASRLRWQQRINEEVAGQSGIPEPSGDFESRVLAAATGRSFARPGLATPVVGGAFAAMLVLGLVLGLNLDDRAPDGVRQADSGTATEAVERSLVPAEPREETVRLAFTSQSQLDNVSLTLELPAHVELVQFPGHQQLTWQVDLKPGDNVIALPLRIAYPDGGEIVARLDDGRKSKTFRARIPGIGETDKEPSS
ncbi:anti-sigma factor family protein [Marinobacter zhanjiangensis]|uniref:Putative zinc-finger domain-containing protein n=1 Tax=Marinobacter zhanjiangensis TaxID=578215 RepID=A0ABQ3B950_9GAMM|nr:zf-HC2 domain-containing protein [Marinobacter zhanjiangensis]GGY83337.1 hypothetical protein GCM10007071_33300 [Marinobacter zhanjiangensis]